MLVSLPSQAQLKWSRTVLFRLTSFSLHNCLLGGVLRWEQHYDCCNNRLTAIFVLRRQLKTKKADWKPLVYILTDGEPTDEWKGPRSEILNRSQGKVFKIITVGCGPRVNEETLKDISTGSAFRMDDDDASFQKFFQWVTMSVQTASRSVSQPGGGKIVNLPPPDPTVIQYIP